MASCYGEGIIENQLAVKPTLTDIAREIKKYNLSK